MFSSVLYLVMYRKQNILTESFELAAKLRFVRETLSVTLSLRRSFRLFYKLFVGYSLFSQYSSTLELKC